MTESRNEGMTDSRNYGMTDSRMRSRVYARDEKGEGSVSDVMHNGKLRIENWLRPILSRLGIADASIALLSLLER